MSENKQNEENRETVADVIATVREVVKFYEKAAEMSKGQLKESFVLTAKNYKEIADLIEAAWERESKAIATENAVLQAVCITKPNGNAAAMREALLEIETVAGEAVENGTMELPQYSKIVDIAESALSAPARNCDVGTAEEQERRFMKYCEAEECNRYRCGHGCKAVCIDRCAVAWSQMPYEAEEGAKKQ